MSSKRAPLTCTGSPKGVTVSELPECDLGLKAATVWRHIERLPKEQIRPSIMLVRA